MEEILAQFEELMEEYREAYERAPNDTAREQVDRRFSDLLTSKEEEVEAQMEAYLEEEGARLLAEQEASLKEIEEAENESPLSISESSNDDVFIILKAQTTKEHKKILKQAGIKGYSRLREDELIDLRIKHGLY